jgi:SPP1 gp7 family putative phage head morphogenesis protein
MGRLAQEPTEFQRARLTRILEDINALGATAFADIWNKYKIEIIDHAKSEAQFSAKLYSKASVVDFALPSEQSLIGAVENIPMAAPKGSRSVMISDAFKDFGAKKTAQITQQIRDGIALGETVPQVSSRISGLMNNLQRRQLDTLVRTATNHVSAAARMETISANDELLEGYKWVATLDSRTTLICASRDGEVYKEGMGPLPPAHWGCRSTIVPVVKKEYSLARGLKGKRPSVGSEGAKAVSARKSYGGWLRKQPKEFIDEALGVERSKLFRSGKYKIDQFVDPTGRVYTLDELNRMSGIAGIEF